MSDRGQGSQRDVIRGMLEAADMGADVISLSLGGRSSDKRQKAYQDAVSYCQEKGAIVVVAAGNSSEDATHIAPANAEGVIAVAALNEKLELASFSNWVNNIGMGCSAPGQNITSTLPGNRYGNYNGTSFAAPFVSSLAAIMKAYKPDLETDEFYRILNATGIKTNSATKSGKLIQPAAALDYLLSMDNIQ